MRDIAKEAIKEFWDFVTDNGLTVVDSKDDFCVYLEPGDLEYFADLYVQDFEQRKKAIICPNGDIYVMVIDGILNGYGISVEQVKELMPKSFKFG